MGTRLVLLHDAMSVFVFWKLIKGVLDLRLRFYEIMILGVSALRIIRFEWSSLATGGQSLLIRET